MKPLTRPTAAMLLTVALLFSAFIALGEVLTNGYDPTLGAPPTPTPRRPPNPQTGLVTNVTDGDPLPPVHVSDAGYTNRLFPPATNSNNSVNLRSPEWFYPNANNKFYSRGTNASYLRGTNGFYSTGPNAEFVPDGTSIYRMGTDGRYHRYDTQGGAYPVETSDITGTNAYRGR